MSIFSITTIQYRPRQASESQACASPVPFFRYGALCCCPPPMIVPGNRPVGPVRCIRSVTQSSDAGNRIVGDKSFQFPVQVFGIAGENAYLIEGAPIQQKIDPFAHRQFSQGMLFGSWRGLQAPWPDLFFDSTGRIYFLMRHDTPQV